MSARGGDTLGGVYAEALADAAQGRGALEQVGAETAALAHAWRDDRTLRAFFLSGAVRREAKGKALEHALRGKASDVLVDFLHVLLRRQRLWLLPAAADAYAALLDRRLGRVAVVLTTASPVSPADLAAWRERLRAAIGLEPVLRHVERPALLGGAVVRVGDVVADGSVRRRIQELRDRLVRAGRAAVNP